MSRGRKTNDRTRQIQIGRISRSALKFMAFRESKVFRSWDQARFGVSDWTSNSDRLSVIRSGLAGRSREEAARCDVVVDILFDFYEQCEHIVLTESDPRKKVYSFAATLTVTVTRCTQNEHWREIYAASGREALGRLDAILRRGTGYFVGNDVAFVLNSTKR